jgi:TRAP transporter TAXI family solute receptor
MENSMKWQQLLIAALTSTLFTFPTLVSAQNTDDTEITIGTGDIIGLYYPTGGAICKLLNEKKIAEHIECSVIATDGSVDNLNKLRQGSIDFGIVQSDWQFHAYNGSSIFAEQAPFEQLRAVFAIHGEPMTVVARADANIHSITDLKGKRLDIGAPGSGNNATMKRVMQALGWTEADFAALQEYPANQQGEALCENKIDAFVYTVGHPNQEIKETALACPIRLINVDSKEIRDMTDANPFYVPMVIPPGMYKGNEVPIKTFGVQATFVTTSEVADQVVYDVVKTVFSHFQEFKQLHPALANLTPQMMLIGNAAPFAGGALKYYKERGWIIDIADHEED